MANPNLMGSEASAIPETSQRPLCCGIPAWLWVYFCHFLPSHPKPVALCLPALCSSASWSWRPQPRGSGFASWASWSKTWAQPCFQVGAPSCRRAPGIKPVLSTDSVPHPHTFLLALEEEKVIPVSMSSCWDGGLSAWGGGLGLPAALRGLVLSCTTPCPRGPRNLDNSGWKTTTTLEKCLHGGKR